MRTKDLRRSAISTALIAAGLFAATADAAVWSGEFDPAFGPANPRLGFRGVGQFFIPDACLDSTGWKDESDCGTMSLISATTQLYDVLDPVPTLDTLNFGPFSPYTDPVWGVLIANVGGVNVVAGVDTYIFGPQPANVVATFPPAGTIYNGPVWEQFQSGCAHNSCFDNDPAYIYINVNNQMVQSLPATVRFTQQVQVPEPGSLGLLIGALATGWLARRRTAPS